MAIETIEFGTFRNIQRAKLTLSPSINLVFGNNGEGKTSFLEGIYYLSLGRSFRTRSVHSLIQYKQEQLSLFAIIDNKRAGIAKHRTGETHIKIEGETVGSTAELANLLPVQLINPDTYALLNDGPKFRREFLDWGVFHVEPNFLKAWREMQRSLKQRNLALKMRAPKEEIVLWDPIFSGNAEKLDEYRKKYFESFKEKFIEILNKFIEIKGLSIGYCRGWPESENLSALLVSSFRNDLRLSHTTHGPHRAELEILIDGIPAKDVLSRGQQKLFVYAMRLAQGILFTEQTGRACTYLIDDLPAELDAEKRDLVLNLLQSFDSQVFITSVELKSLETMLQGNLTKVFHVEHGVLSEYALETSPA
jgi:DNA replication and repair protein RecF